MSARTYKVWALGSPVGDGVSGSIHVGMAAIAKRASTAEPNIVINEVLCNTLARALFLPCPPGALIDNGGEPYFCSLNFNLAGQSLPPANVPDLISTHPKLCWGIILFDIFVMNPDRHDQNLSFDRSTGEVQIFDHSIAFLSPGNTIDTIIAKNSNKLGFVGHCLKDHIAINSGLDYWINRFKSLPDYAIEETVNSLIPLGFPADKKQLTIDFFKSRRGNIELIVQNNISLFPKIASLTAATSQPKHQK